MPYTTNLTTDYMGVVHVGTGVVSGKELLKGSQAVAQLVQDTENFHFEFVDLSGATEVQITPEELHEIAATDERAAHFRPDATVVIVAPNDAIFALAKQWEESVRHLGWTSYIARDRKVALQWLGDNFRRPEPAGVPAEGPAPDAAEAGESAPPASR